MQRRRVLVTGSGGPAAIAFMQAVGFERVQLFAADLDPNAAGLYLVPAAQRCLVPRGDSAELVPRLLALVEQHHIEHAVKNANACREYKQHDYRGKWLLLL